MKKSVIIAIAATALLAPALSAAVAAPPEQCGEKGGHCGLSAEDRAALLDARIAAFKTGLKLTPAQEKHWPAVEAAIREQAKARAARWAEWREKRAHEPERHDAIEALAGRAKRLQERSAQVAALAEAAKPLYESLDDGQKHRFELLAHALGGWRHAGYGHWGRGERG
jgi:hypothetical protein